MILGTFIRDLAKEYQVSWKEYWPFLRDFVDFRSDEGLKKLEKYLKQKFIDYESQLPSFKMVGESTSRAI